MMRRVAQMRAEKMIGMLFGMRKIISSVVAGLLCFGASISVPASAQADDLKAMLDKAGQEKTGVDLTAGRTYVVPETLNVPEGGALHPRTRCVPGCADAGNKQQACQRV